MGIDIDCREWTCSAAGEVKAAWIMRPVLTPCPVKQLVGSCGMAQGSSAQRSVTTERGGMGRMGKETGSGEEEMYVCS